tara:strand:+ start:28 stop:213 length:186 start_codon:yes stop_codon:yes gene_type:complete
MHFYKKTSIGKSNNYIKLLIKLILAFLLFIAILFMLDQINFPAPNKKIENLIPNENFKVIK